MSLIQWSSEYSTGIDSIDQQHKKLVNIINTLHDAQLNGQAHEILASIFEQLTQYTEQHFSYEEQLFVRYEYEDSPAHKLEHLQLIRQINELKAKMDEGDISIDTQVMNFLKDWLNYHILVSDKNYSEFLISKGVV